MRQRTVLLITSSPQEAQRLQQTLEQTGLHHTLRVVYDGEEALAYLWQARLHADLRHDPCPDIIVLDLPLPRLRGLEFLQRLKQDQRLKRVPTLVLTTSIGSHEVRQAYAAGANACLWKPVEGPDFAEVMGQIGKFWLETVALPSDA